MTTPTFVTADETRTSARTLLSRAIEDHEHVAADEAETRGDVLTAHRLRNMPAYSGPDHERFVVDRKYLPPTLRGIDPWMLLVAAYADEETTAVTGHYCFGIDVTAVTKEVFDEGIVEWSTVRYAPLRTQQALAMLLIAEVRDHRMAGRVYRILKGKE